MKEQWLVVHVLSRTEKKVAARLEDKGITVYLPLQKQLRQWSDRKKWVDMVVVSGYVFVKTTYSEHSKILETLGVSRFLRHCNNLVYISDLEMERFQNFIKKAKSRPIEFTTEMLSVGTPVTVQSGQFKGFFGEVTEYKGKYKLSVKLSSFGSFFVTLSSANVLPQQ
jgi:transcription antitermination factor NusG